MSRRIRRWMRRGRKREKRLSKADRLEGWLILSIVANAFLLLGLILNGLEAAQYKRWFDESVEETRKKAQETCRAVDKLLNGLDANGMPKKAGAK